MSHMYSSQTNQSSCWTAFNPDSNTTVPRLVHRLLFYRHLLKGLGCKADYEGINGKTCWIFITDHFTGMKHGDTRILRGPPLQWLAHFLAQYNPQCDGKYVYLDQGGELFNHPEVRNLFWKKSYDIFPTGADNSHQNGPVKQGHCTLASTIRTLLVGANLNIKFWPYRFYHAL